MKIVFRLRSFFSRRTMKNGGLLNKMRAFWAETSGLFIVSGCVSFWGTRCLSHSAASYAIPALHSPIAHAKSGHVNDSFGMKARFDAKECFVRKLRSEQKWRETHLCRVNPCRSSYSIRGRNSDCWTARCSKFQAYYLLVFTKVAIFVGRVWQNRVFLLSKAYFKLKNCAFSNSSCIFVLEI